MSNKSIGIICDDRARQLTDIENIVVYAPRGVFRITEHQTVILDGKPTDCLRLKSVGGGASINVPMARAETGALKPLPSIAAVEQAFSIMQAKRRPSRQPWIRRAVALEAKIKTCDPSNLAEVLRDLKRGVEQTQSERFLHDRAAGILASVISSVMDVTIAEAKTIISDALDHSKRENMEPA